MLKLIYNTISTDSTILNSLIRFYGMTVYVNNTVSNVNAKTMKLKNIKTSTGLCEAYLVFQVLTFDTNYSMISYCVIASNDGTSRIIITNNSTTII